ncbi:MAG: hypothetical protein ACTHJ9_16920 [Rhodanobacter sp.]
MTIAAHASPARLLARSAMLLTLGFSGAAGAAQVTPAIPGPTYAPVPGDAFRHAVRQQQLRDQVRQSELQQQLQQNVSDNAKRPGAKNELLQRQLELADQARRERDRAALMDLLDRQRAQGALPRVIPTDAPASSRSGG